MKTNHFKSHLAIITALLISVTTFSCEGDNGDATEGSYMKVGNTTFQLDKGAFSLSSPNIWEQDGELIAHYYHNLVMYSDDISIIKNTHGYDSLITGNGGMFSCMVHPFDSTSIVGEYTFGSWDWDGDEATHGLPTKVSPDSTVYYGEMTTGNLSISMNDNSMYTITIDGFAYNWENKDSIAVEIRYTGGLNNDSQK